MGSFVQLTSLDGTASPAWVARPDVPARGAVVVLQEIFGVNAHIRAVADRISRETGLPIAINLVSSYPAQPFHADCVDAVARAAKALGYSHMPVVSGAGHDAVYMARLAPAGMVFIPCKDGISHNEIEDAEPAHLEAGCNVLLRAMLAAAGVVQAADGGVPA